jgi:hypothetical protein
MTYHLCRDFQTNSNSSQADPGYNDLSGGAPFYILSIFLRYVLGYTQVGETNWNLNAAPFLISGSSVTTASITISGSTSYVNIPSSVYTVSGSSDVGRIVALKSPANPTTNSGVFLITGVDTVNNRYVVSTRIGNSGTLITESGLSWYVLENDALVTGDGSGGTTYAHGWSYLLGNNSIYGANTSPNNASTATSYAGNGTAISPRIILQSPHSTGWQVRLAHEPSGHVSDTSLSTTYFTIAPGFNGNSAGDFPLYQPCLHAGLYYNNNPNNLEYTGLQVGLYSQGFANGSRVTIGGDDTGQAVVIIARPVANSFQYESMCVFGIPDNEPTPLPPTSIQRLFVLGQAGPGNYGISFLFTGSAGGLAGVGFGLDQSLCTCCASCWSQTARTTTNQGQSPMFSGNAGDNPFINATELIPVDLVNGVLWGNAGAYGIGGGSVRVTNQQPRTIGTIPWLRAGRSNFPTWSTTTDSLATPAWYHTINGVFLQWGGPPPIP